MSLILYNGTFLPEDEKVVSINDRSFRFGDGVFETISVYGGKIYQEKFHKSRLNNSMGALRIRGVDVDTIFESAKELIVRNSVDVGFTRITISRGEGGEGYLPPENQEPNIVISTKRRDAKLPEHASIWVSNMRKPPVVCLPTNSKTANGINSVLARMEARENGCFEALLLDMESHVCEGSSANIFWSKGGKLFTPSADTGLLAGSIREAVIRTSPFEIVEGLFQLSDLLAAEEVFLTNVSWVVMPVDALSPGGKRYVSGNTAAMVAHAINEDIKLQCNL